MGTSVGGRKPSSAGALRVDSKILVATSSGHRQVTPTPVPSSSMRRDSDSPTTPYFAAW